MEIDRRALLRAGAATLVVGCHGRSTSEETPVASTPGPVFPLSQPLAPGVGLTGLPYPELAEQSIADLAKLSAVELVARYKGRIAALDDKLHAVIELNP